jgi:hypothetical protein
MAKMPLAQLNNDELVEYVGDDDVELSPSVRNAVRVSPKLSDDMDVLPLLGDNVYVSLLLRDDVNVSPVLRDNVDVSPVLHDDVSPVLHNDVNVWPLLRDDVDVLPLLRDDVDVSCCSTTMSRHCSTATSASRGSCMTAWKTFRFLSSRHHGMRQTPTRPIHSKISKLTFLQERANLQNHLKILNDKLQLQWLHTRKKKWSMKKNKATTLN